MSIRPPNPVLENEIRTAQAQTRITDVAILIPRIAANQQGYASLQQVNLILASLEKGGMESMPNNLPIMLIIAFERWTALQASQIEEAFLDIRAVSHRANTTDNVTLLQQPKPKKAKAA